MKVQIPEWQAHGNAFPNGESLADTALMPPPEPKAPPAVRRVK
jgi:hypothetical protein